MCFGSAGKDMLFPTGEGKMIETPEDLMSQKKIAFELGAKIRIKEKYEALGGCAANVAVGMARLGIGTLCASSVGNDFIGNWVREELEKNKVSVEPMVVEEGRDSDFSAIIVDEASADRIIFTNKNSSGKLNFDNLRNTEVTWFFVSDIYGKWEDQLEAIFEAAKSGNKRVAFNPREAGIREDAAEIIEAIGLCEIVFVNKDEAIEIVSNMKGDADPENVRQEKYLIEKLKSLEPKIVVLTDGTRGAWATNGEDFFHVAAKKVQAVDSTGAGDSFTSAFLSAYIKGKSLSECLQWGVANSASEVQHYGAIDGLLVEAEIVKETEGVTVEKL